MNQYVDNILHAFALLADDPDQLQRIGALSGELEWADPQSVAEMLGGMANLAPGISPPILDRGAEIVVQKMARSAEGPESAGGTSDCLAGIAGLYRTLESSARTRNYLLNWLARINSRESLELFARLVSGDPPTCEKTIVMAFAPLVRFNHAFAADALFPEILGGLQHPSVAAAILDLANFLTREGRVEEHPASQHIDSLINMLGLLTEQLAMIEEGNLPETADPLELSRRVNDTVSLIASLCDALALIGNPRAQGKLTRAAGLKHRRIRAEALAALVRLGDEDSADELLGLAAEPVARLRILHYAEELALLDRIDPQWLTPESRAESELAIWLASPSNMGLAPGEIEFLDQRHLAWPGYDDPIDCFLVRYRYELAHQSIENIGIVGPVTHAFSFPLTTLDCHDIYAAFAGWHCTHEEIEEIAPDQANQLRPGVIERLMSRLASEQLEGLDPGSVAPVFLGLFMGQEVLVAEGIRDDRHGTLVVDRDEVEWFAPPGGDAPGRNELAWSIYKGRRLLSAFNPSLRF